MTDWEQAPTAGPAPFVAAAALLLLPGLALVLLDVSVRLASVVLVLSALLLVAGILVWFRKHA